MDLLNIIALPVAIVRREIAVAKIERIWRRQRRACTRAAKVFIAFGRRARG